MGGWHNKASSSTGRFRVDPLTDFLRSFVSVCDDIIPKINKNKQNKYFVNLI